MKQLALLAAPFLLTGCAVVPHAPIVSGTPLPEGSLVALDQPVQLGTLVLTPKKVVEDSRCPINARCVWAGRAIVTTRIDGDGWRETRDLTLGETFGTRGQLFALVTVEPGQIAGSETEAKAYRFGYEAR